MIHLSDDLRKRAFATWLRTGRLLPMPDEDGLERKFNPWHDPANGRFTFAGAGQRAGAATAPRPTNRANPSVEFVRGAGEGVYDTVSGAARGAYAAVTTNPVTTARELGRAAARTIDATVAAEDVPARVRLARAADAVAHASAHDLGRAAGSTAANVALTYVPGAAMSKVAAARGLQMADAGGAAFEPVEIGWAPEKLKEGRAKDYNDRATGARPGQAPTIARTMPNGSKRPVKFDGLEGEYLIDRKMAIRDQANARAQVARQSQALTQNRLIAVWEVPDEKQKIRALKLLKKTRATNIKVRVAKS